MKPELTIIIVNWNSKDHVKKCLKSIDVALKHFGKATQIIVIDGASYDGCGEMISNEFPNVEFIQSEYNIGFGACNNLAFHQALGRYVFFLNPDTVVEFDAIQKLHTAIKEHPDAGVVGAKLLNNDGTIQDSCIRKTPNPLITTIGSEYLKKKLPFSILWGPFAKDLRDDCSHIVDAISGAAMFMRYDVFSEIGRFSKEFFMYGEDMDLCMKSRKYGYLNYYIPGAKIVHYGGGSSSEKLNAVSIVMKRISGYKYFNRNYGIHIASLYRFLQLVSAVIRISIVSAIAIKNGTLSKGNRNTLKKWWFVSLCSLFIEKVAEPSDY